jgi:hypothetical protein
MPRAAEQILADIDAYQPAGGDWRGLDDLLAELWAIGVPPSAIPTLLHVFDRFPDEDGAGVFWSIVHGVESLPDYEPLLVQSAESQPARFKSIMLDRLNRSSKA